MPKLDILPRSQNTKAVVMHRRLSPSVRARADHVVRRDVRHEVALDILLHFLRRELYADGPLAEERIIQW